MLRTSPAPPVRGNAIEVALAPAPPCEIPRPQFAHPDLGKTLQDGHLIAEVYGAAALAVERLLC